MTAAAAAVPPVLVPVPRAQVQAMAQHHAHAGRHAQAGALLGHILTACPHDAEALHLAAVVAHRQGRQQDAIQLMRRTMAHGSDTPLYHRNIAELYRLAGQLAQAEAAARRAVALTPGDPLALLNLGLVLTDQGHPKAAIACLEQALALDPDNAAVHFGLAEALLVRGAFARGWEEYEWRFRLPGADAQLPKTRQPQWDGTPLADGTLLLFADQGFGDAIQFGRYIAWAAARCPRLSLACSKPLAPILAQLHPGLRIFSNWRDAGSFAAWIPLTGLPRLAGTTLPTIPADTPYLRADPAAAARWRTRLDGLVAPGLRRIGLVWAGRPTHRNDARRSTTLAALAPIAACDGIALLVLQKGPSQAQTGCYQGRAPLVHLSAEVADFRDTMAIIDGLDLVISVDTSVAHLAGAMGRPVWIMLPHVAEWRWLEGRADSPWYPSARLFRQTAAGDWPGTAAAVAAALAAPASMFPSPFAAHDTAMNTHVARARGVAMENALEAS